MKRAEDSLRDLWDHIKCTNIIGVPEEKEKKKRYKKIFEEIIVENFPNMEQQIANQVQEAQRDPYKINTRRKMPRHILIKLTKTKHRSDQISCSVMSDSLRPHESQHAGPPCPSPKNIKSSKGEATSNIQGKPHMFNS